jgi:hypothetical protein
MAVGPETVAISLVFNLHIYPLLTFTAMYLGAWLFVAVG